MVAQSEHLQQTTTFWTLQGEELRLAGLPPEHARFLAQMQAMVDNRHVSDADMEQMIWSTDNPLMKAHPETGRAFADLEVFANPLFQVVLDLLTRKRINSGTLDPGAARARYTMTVGEAAKQLGIHEASVRKAISARRLAAWKQGGTHWLDPASVDSYLISTRGARAEVQESSVTGLDLDSGELLVRYGTDGDYTLQIKTPPNRGAAGIVEDGQGVKVFEAKVPAGWKRVAILRGKKKKNDYRLFILEPDAPNPILDTGLTFAGFYVRGAFRVAQKENNSTKATTGFKEFDAE